MDPKHAAMMISFALRAQEEAAKVPRPDTDEGSTLQMRVGESLWILSDWLSPFAR